MLQHRTPQAAVCDCHGKATAAIPPAATCRYGTAAPQRPSTAPARVQEPARYPGGGRSSAAPTSSPAGYVGAHATLSEPCTAAAANPCAAHVGAARTCNARRTSPSVPVVYTRSAVQHASLHRAAHCLDARTCDGFAGPTCNRAFPVTTRPMTSPSPSATMISSTRAPAPRARRRRLRRWPTRSTIRSSRRLAFLAPLS